LSILNTFFQPCPNFLDEMATSVPFYIARPTATMDNVALIFVGLGIWINILTTPENR
jgi:hypothetical protein